MLQTPQIKTHLSVHIIPGQGALVLTEGSTRALHGTLYEHVLPLVDGRRRTEDIVLALASGSTLPVAELTSTGRIATDVRFGLPTLKRHDAALSGRRVESVEARGKALIAKNRFPPAKSTDPNLLGIARALCNIYLALVDYEHLFGVIAFSCSCTSGVCSAGSM